MRVWEHFISEIASSTESQVWECIYGLPQQIRTTDQIGYFEETLIVSTLTAV